MAMGGAFIALADDATATEFNPAGLWNLRRPEFAMQVKYTVDDHREFLPLKTQNGLGDPEFGEFTDRYANLSFAALSYPTQYAAFSISYLNPIFYTREMDESVIIKGIQDEFFRDYDISLENYGLTAAFAVTPKLSLGVTGKYGVFNYEEKTLRGKNDLNDETYGANFGLLWRAHRYWSFGVVYKTEQKIEGNFRGENLDLQIPSTVSAGVAFHPNDRLRILADIDHANWSDYDESLDSNRDETGLVWKRQDVTRYHLGAEYLLGAVKDTAYFVRCGWMHEDSNQLFYDGRDAFEFFEKLGPKPDSINHYSFGLGLVRKHFQLDFAGDYSEDKLDLILSTVIYF